MIVQCIANTAEHVPLSARVLDENDDTSYYGLIVGDKYTVYAVMWIASRVDVLIATDAGGPVWVPMMLFRLVDGRLPDKWAMCVTEQSEAFRELATYYNIAAIVGYKRIVEDINHYNGILEREHREIMEFYAQKEEIDSTCAGTTEW